MTIRLAVLGSTRGTNLAAIFEAITQNELDAKVEVVVSNRAEAYILTRAQQHGVANHFVAVEHCNRQQYDQKVQAVLQRYSIDLVVMIGYMRIVSPWFVEKWPNKIINVHPSLLPKHAGLMNLAVHQAVLDAGESKTGCTVHFVSEVVDGGSIILQKKCVVEQGDTAQSLKQKVQALEAQALIESIQTI